MSAVAVALCAWTVWVTRLMSGSEALAFGLMCAQDTDLRLG
jgi:hypothetical protein